MVSEATAAEGPRGLGDCEEAPPRGTSKQNPAETAMAVDVVRALRFEEMRLSVMVITFYKSQEALLRRAFEAAGFGAALAGAGLEDKAGRGSLRILTVDQAQGSESDVVVLSSMRSNLGGGIGFVANPNRLNVAVSRARMCLVIVGDHATLGRNGTGLWAALVAQATHVSAASAMPAIVA